MTVSRLTLYESVPSCITGDDRLLVGLRKKHSAKLPYHKVKERQVEGLIVTARRCHQSEKVEEFRLGSEDTGSPNLSGS